MHISDKFILIREYSPANFEYVERWNMYSTLSHNLAVGCLFFFVISFIKIFIELKDHPLYWIVICLISFLLFFIFIKSAHVYNQWAGRDLNSAISALKLREKTNDINH
jgi:FtsH-binding integral membrane protein